MPSFGAFERTGKCHDVPGDSVSLGLSLPFSLDNQWLFILEDCHCCMPLLILILLPVAAPTEQAGSWPCRPCSALESEPSRAHLETHITCSGERELSLSAGWQWKAQTRSAKTTRLRKREQGPSSKDRGFGRHWRSSSAVRKTHTFPCTLMLVWAVIFHLHSEMTTGDASTWCFGTELRWN